MSDSEHSTVTYTSVSSPVEDYSDIGSPGVDGPPSPDYVPGPEEPEQAPPSPIYLPYVPEPVYPEYIPPEDDVFPAEEQPLHAAASPTAESPGYIPESDPEEDDEEDPEEDPREISIQDEPSISLPPREEVERLLALTTPPPSPLTPLSSPLPHIPSPPLPIPSPPPNSPTYSEAPLGFRAAGIRQRDTPPSPVHETEIPEICLPLRKRPCRTAPTLGYEVGESSAAGVARQDGPAVARADLYGFVDMVDAAQGRLISSELGYGITDTWDDLEDEIIYSQLDDARYDRALLRARVNMLYRDRPFHRRTALLMEENARVSRAAWAQSMDAWDLVHFEGISLRTTVMAQQSEITELQAAD
ncbi:hypothetical protein Tco_1496080, partial [Tanacetum coccineum]